jgi:cytidylate kinase
MKSVAERLAHVLWIGGAPCAGKTTLSRLLAGKYDFRIYNLDWHYAREDRFRSGPAVRWWGAHNMDERWVDISADDLLERSTQCWNERFPVAVDELLTLPASRGIVVESPGAAPWLVAPVIGDPRQAIFLVPDQALRDRVVAERERRGTSLAYAATRDPERARSNHRERDRRFSLRIETSCRELGLHILRMRDPLDIDANLALVEGHFAPRLPSALNV